MKQFLTVLKFELKNYYKNKIFVGVTVLIVLAVGVLMFFPQLKATLSNTGVNLDSPDETANMYILSADPDIANNVRDAFAPAFPDYNVVTSYENTDWLIDKIKSGEIQYGFYFESYSSYTYYLNNISMYDANTAIADEVLKSLCQRDMMVASGITEKSADEIMSVQIQHTTENIGKDQANNFFYTYIMLFALYIMILLYGQLVSTSVATEKSSRAMELLITSASPNNMMFGKIIAACIAGFVQMIAVFGSSILFYSLNKSYWADNEIIKSIFAMPPSLFVYLIVFFLLGFFIYAFLYGAIGSTVSKLEDINTAVMPLTFVFLFSLMAVMFSMTGSTVDSGLMKFLSFFPLTSPMAMFTRIAMSTVPAWQIAVSIAVLIVTAALIGIGSAKVYRIGVLLYGTPPKPSAIIKAIKNSK